LYYDDVWNDTPPLRITLFSFSGLWEFSLDSVKQSEWRVEVHPMTFEDDFFLVKDLYFNAQTKPSIRHWRKVFRV